MPQFEPGKFLDVYLRRQTLFLGLSPVDHWCSVLGAITMMAAVQTSSWSVLSHPISRGLASVLACWPGLACITCIFPSTQSCYTLPHFHNSMGVRSSGHWKHVCSVLTSPICSPCPQNHLTRDVSSGDARTGANCARLAGGLRRWWAGGGPNRRVAAHTGETCGLCPTTGRDTTRTTAGTPTRTRTMTRTETRTKNTNKIKTISLPLANHCKGQQGQVYQ